MAFTPTGIFAALVTPSTSQGEVDEGALRSLVGFLIENGINGLVPLGGTGEYVSLSAAERQRVVKIVIDEAKVKTPVVAGVLEPGIRDALEMAKYAEDVGADGVLVVTPYYNKPSQLGLYRYYETLAGALDIPIMLYNIPYKTGTNLEPETVAQLSEFDNIIAIKECNRDLGHFSRLVRVVGSKMSVLCGEEDLLLAEMMLGAKGAVLATANAFPRVWLDIYGACQESRYADAITIYRSFQPLLEQIFSEPNPIGLKQTLTLLRRSAGDVRLPLLAMEERSRDILERRLSQFLKQEIHEKPLRREISRRSRQSMKSI